MKALWRNFTKWLGYKYVMNKRSEETHDLDNIKTNCKLDIMADKNKKYITKRQFLTLHKRGEADGCRWCMKEYNHLEELSHR